MTFDQANQFIQIYNSLLQISTKGEDTIIMGRCLQSLQTLLSQIEIKQEEKEDGSETLSSCN